MLLLLCLLLWAASCDWNTIPSSAMSAPHMPPTQDSALLAAFMDPSPMSTDSPSQFPNNCSAPTQANDF